MINWLIKIIAIKCSTVQSSASLIALMLSHFNFLNNRKVFDVISWTFNIQLLCLLFTFIVAMYLWFYASFLQFLYIAVLTQNV